MIVEVIMTGLLAYQVWMPAVDNGKFMMVHDGQNIIRMNTQDGTMERCSADFKCSKIEVKKDKEDKK